MDRWVERLFPYWSIGINVLLGLMMLQGGRDAGAEYGRKFAAVISTVTTFFQNF